MWVQTWARFGLGRRMRMAEPFENGFKCVASNLNSDQAETTAMAVLKTSLFGGIRSDR